MTLNWVKVALYTVVVGAAALWFTTVHDKRPVPPTVSLPSPVAVVEKPLPPTVTREKRAPAPKKVEKPEPAPKHHVKTCKDVPAQAYTMSVDSVVEIAKRQGLNNYTVEKLRNCLTNRQR